jgi:hypothetical protein
MRLAGFAWVPIIAAAQGILHPAAAQQPSASLAQAQPSGIALPFAGSAATTGAVLTLANTGIGDGIDVKLGATALTDAQTVLRATNDGGTDVAAGKYGHVAVFKLTNALNQSDALYVSTNSTGVAIRGFVSGQGIGVVGQDASSGKTGVGVMGSSKTGIAVEGVLLAGNDMASSGAAGISAVAAFDQSNPGAFTYGLWASSPNNVAVFGTSRNVAARFSGGRHGTASCAYLGGSGGWECSAGAALMRNAIPADTAGLLDRLAALPVFEYSMLGAADAEIRYVGPSAEAFFAAFHLGGDATAIASGNAAGVALAAAQGLLRKLRTDEAEIAGQAQTIAALRRDLLAARADTDARLAALERRLGAPALRASLAQ